MQYSIYTHGCQTESPKKSPARRVYNHRVSKFIFSVNRLSDVCRHYGDVAQRNGGSGVRGEGLDCKVRGMTFGRTARLAHHRPNKDGDARDIINFCSECFDVANTVATACVPGGNDSHPASNAKAARPVKQKPCRDCTQR